MKKFIIVLLSILIFIGIIKYGADPAADSLVRSRLDTAIQPGVAGVCVLMYHKVNPNPLMGGLGLRVPPVRFKNQMQYLAQNGYHTISLTELAAILRQKKPLPTKVVVITFDDGYRDNYKYAFPILKKYGFTATVFVVANTVGGINQFDVRNGQQPENEMATWQELRKMAGQGMEIGSHTLDHPRLTRLPAAEAERQIKESKVILENHLERPVRVFSYPYGDWNPAIAGLVEESGYVAAVTTVQGHVLPGDNLYSLRRIRIMGNYNMKMFIKKLNEVNPPSRT